MDRWYSCYTVSLRGVFCTGKWWRPLCRRVTGCWPRTCPVLASRINPRHAVTTVMPAMSRGCRTGCGLLDLRNIILICQDWGGLIGMRLVAEEPDRFARVVTTNTMLPTGDHAAGDAFLQWQKFSQQTPVFPTGQIVSKGTVKHLSSALIAAYDAPFPDEILQGRRQTVSTAGADHPRQPGKPGQPRKPGKSS